MDDSSRRSPASPAVSAAPSRSTHPESSPARVSLVAAVRGWLKHTLGSRGESSLKEALEEVIEEHDADPDDRLEPEERVMLHNVLSFGDLTVSDIMVPRTDIVAVPVDIMLSELKDHIIEQQHTRMPVYQDTLDNLLGFLHVKDLLPILAGDTAFDPHAMMRPLIFVPPSMRILDLLVKMRSSGSHMAIVVDEYGGTDGLVTMEDLFEEIVGDIHDEHDDDEADDEHISQPNDGVYEVSARIRIETLEQKLGLQLVTEEREDDFDTLGGLIFFQLGRVPAKGEMVEHISGMHFEIVDADPRRIHRVRIVAGGTPAQAA
jgi:magnesium and cobalt transporter